MRQEEYEEGHGKSWAPEINQRAAAMWTLDGTVLPYHTPGHSRSDSTFHDCVRYTNHPPYPPVSNLAQCHPALPCPPWSLRSLFERNQAALGNGASCDWCRELSIYHYFSLPSLGTTFIIILFLLCFFNNDHREPNLQVRSPG